MSETRIWFSSFEVKNFDRSGIATELFQRIVLVAHLAMSRIASRHAFKGEVQTIVSW